MTDGNTVLTITPSTTLAVGKSYHIEIDATAFAFVGKAYPGIGNSTTLAFTTVTAPNFSAVTPAASAYINAAATVGYTLSKTVDSASITFTRSGGETDIHSPETCTLLFLSLTSGAQTVGLGQGGWSGCTSDITLVDGATYTVALSATDSMSLTGTASITDVTYDITAPKADATTPISANDADSSNSYTANDTLTLKFSEPVATADVTSANLTVSGSHTLGASGVTVSPVSASNGYAQSYTVTLGAGTNVVEADTLTIAAASVVDRAGNPAAVGVVFTLPSPIPPINITGAAAVSGIPGATTTNFTVTTDATGTGCWAIQPSAAAAPTDADALCAIAATSATVLDFNGNLSLNAGSATPFSNSVALTRGTAYKLYLTARKNGYSTAVQTVSFTTAAISAPAIPTNLIATAGNGSVSVAFNPPEDDGGAAVTEYTASCAPATANQFAAFGDWTASQTGSASPITVSGLTNGTAYRCEVKASNNVGYGDYSSASNRFTPAAPPPPGADYTPPPSNTLPTGGSAATLTGGQSVTVTENGEDGTAIYLPPPSTTGSNSVNVTLPGTGTVGISSGSNDTQLGVTHVTLPGTTTSVSTVTVEQGSASLTASQSGQAMGGLKNGIVVVSGTDKSQVSVDTTGANAKIGITSSDTIIVPTGSAGVSGTQVNLPPPTASGGAASTVSVKIGDQNLTIQSSQSNTTMTFKVVDIGGVQTPVLAVTGSAQVSGSGDNQPLVTVNGNVIKTGKSGGGSSQVCNTILQASSNTTSGAVHVVTCYIVLDTGSFSALDGGGKNGFAAIKDGIVWAGETAEFDKSGKVTSAYLGSRIGTTSAVGDDLAPGGNKFADGSYQISAFIPRLNGTPLRLNGAKLDESIYAALRKALGDMQPARPVQSSQGVLNVTFTRYGVPFSALPSRRVRVDTSRPDGFSATPEGIWEVVTGGLVTTFVPSVVDPKAFAKNINQETPGSTSTLRWNGSWQVKASDGTTLIGRPQWGFSAAAPGAETFILFSSVGQLKIASK